MTAAALATAILVVHLAVVAFNVGGLILVPLGGWLGWGWVRRYWLRLLHLLSLAAVALQALFGRACILTIWQFALQSGGRSGEPEPMIATWIDRLLYWPLPHWVFVAAYVAVFAYTLLLWRWVPPHRLR
ncbi:MAG TPA: DUF2784 family protein [Alphaproteobacteria bacterium]|nr:DUF2784 family protein [Alphaproteobacteria bacterium]